MSPDEVTAPTTIRLLVADDQAMIRAGLRMIREAVETLGPPGVLPSGEAVISLYGPEPIHEPQAIVDALTAILGDEPDPGTVKPQPRRWPRMTRPETPQIERRSPRGRQA